MTRILFVCYGNICRSPMAQYIFLDMARRKGIDLDVEVGSAATSTDSIDGPVYRDAADMLKKHGIGGFSGHRAHQLTMEDYRHYDRIYVMEEMNLRDARRMTGGDPDCKICKLLDRDVADPWYTGDFTVAYNDIVEGCAKLVEELIGRK